MEKGLGVGKGLIRGRRGTATEKDIEEPPAWIDEDQCPAHDADDSDDE